MVYIYIAIAFTCIVMFWIYIYGGVIGWLYNWRLIIEISLINLDGFMIVSVKNNRYIMGQLMGYIYILLWNLSWDFQPGWWIDLVDVFFLAACQWWQPGMMLMGTVFFCLKIFFLCSSKMGKKQTVDRYQQNQEEWRYYANRIVPF